MSVKIKIQDIELSLEEAREVYLELKKVFDRPEAVPYIPGPYVPAPWQPVSPSVPQWPLWQPIITC